MYEPNLTYKKHEVTEGHGKIFCTMCTEDSRDLVKSSHNGRICKACVYDMVDSLFMADYKYRDGDA